MPACPERTAMRLTPSQRRMLLAIRADRQTESGATAGAIAWKAGLKEQSALRAVKQLENRGLVEKLPRAYPGDHPYSTWGTRWELRHAGMEAVS